MKRIVSLFFVLFLIILFGQGKVKETIEDYYYKANKPFFSYTAGINAGVPSASGVFVSGYKVGTKADDTTGTNRSPNRHIIYWPDSTEMVTNGTFNSDISGWTTYLNPVTREWVASGGGFTGAMHLVTNGNLQGTYQRVDLSRSGYYRFRFDLNITSMTSSAFVVKIVTSPNQLLCVFTTTGVTHIDTTFYFPSYNDAILYIQQGGAGGVEFYIDNISTTLTADSVQSYSHNIYPYFEDTRYYSMQSLNYVEKDGDSVYVVSAIDTCISFINATQFTDLTSGILQFTDPSLSEVGFNYQVDTVTGDFTTPLIDDTTAVNVTSVDVTSLLTAGGNYKARVRTIGDNINSDWTNAYSFTTPAIVLDITPPSAPTDVDAINLTKLTLPVPADTIPTFSSYSSNVGSAEPDSYHEFYLVLANFDSAQACAKEIH